MINWRFQLSDIDFGEEETSALMEVLKSKWLTMGPKTATFEEEFAAFIGAKYAIAVTNGTAALHLAHWALGIDKDDEVICPSLSFVATANSILYSGAKPVFADITSLDDLTINPDSVRELITPKTKCITVMHYGGYPADLDCIVLLAQQHHCRVIEDACHAIGTEYHAKKCGTLGDIGCFSFFSNKNMVTGEGGMVVTNDAKLAEKMRLGRSHGMTAMSWDRHRGHAHSYDVVHLGYNYRIDEIRAALGSVQLRKLEKLNVHRCGLAAQYRQALSKIQGIHIPFSNFDGKSAHHLFPILLDTGVDRSRFMSAMRKLGVQTSIHYPAIHEFSFYRKIIGKKLNHLQNTVEAARTEVTLPLHPLLTESDIHEIADCVRFSLQEIEND